MKVSVIGTGYVGLISGVGYASQGHDVICVDVIEEKVAKINAGEPPIHEAGLPERLRQVLDKGKFKATTDITDAIENSDICFISVGTPSAADGSIDLKYIEQASKDLGTALKNKDSYFTIVVKSTVTPGTTEGTVIKNVEEASGKKAGQDFGVCMNPEFLREGKAIEDFDNPDRIVIGSLDEKSAEALKALNKSFTCPVLETPLSTAEMIKYVSNAFLAVKISYANEVAEFCKKIGSDPYEVFKGVGLDKRINPAFFNSGLGWGGSCFPKDTKEFAAAAKREGANPRIVDAAIETNKILPSKIVELAGDVSGKTIAVLGLAFKAGTDDVRESQAVEVIKLLNEKGAKIQAYDPEAAEVEGLERAETMEKALEGADICLVLTEWPEFANIPFSGKIIDGRNIVENRENYEGLFW